MQSLRSKRVSLKTMMMRKPKFCRSKSNNLPKPEKIWVDKGREFAGEFSRFCRENDIGLYSTHSETKTAFAERNIRSLKAIVFKFLYEGNTDTYIENLQQLVNVMNCRGIGSQISAKRRWKKWCSLFDFTSVLQSNSTAQIQNGLASENKTKNWNISSGLPNSIYRGVVHLCRSPNTEPAHIHH